MVSRLCTAPLVFLSSCNLINKFLLSVVGNGLGVTLSAVAKLLESRASGREVAGGPPVGSAVPLHVVL